MGRPMRLAFHGALAVLAVVAIVVCSGAAAAALAPGPESASAARTSRSAAPATVAGGPAAPTPRCPAGSGDAAAWFAPSMPVAVRASLQSACPFVPDQTSLSFLSNASGSGARFQFTVDLPAGGASPATAFSSFGLGTWVSGVPCSLDGAAFLNVELEPPYHYAGANGSANWTVQAPVDDLVPAGSCDPQCQNATATYSIAGTPYCEDDVVWSGVGAPTARGWGNFSPGDRLNITFVGSVGGLSGLTVYLNDSSHPSADLTWTYDYFVTVDDAPLAPLADAAGWAPGPWGYGGQVEADVQNCPTLGADGAATCDSYDGPAWTAAAAPTIVHAAYWNATTLTYANGYDWTATASSTGACASSACSDFTTFGGTGAYPYWSLRGFDGVASWQYGLSRAATLQSWGGASQFAPNGTATVEAVPSVAPLAGTQIGNHVYLDAIAADPAEVQAVEFGAYWCFAGATPTAATAAGTLTASLVDTNFDGNWTASFSTGTYSGTLHTWARAQSFAGGWSSPVYGATNVTGVTACTLPAPAAPTFTAANVTAAGGGFALNWTEAGPAITGFTVYANATGAGPHDVVALGNVTHVLVDPGLPTSTNYSLTVIAHSADLLGAGATVTGAVPLPLLTAALAGPTQPLWVTGAAASFTATASGGTAPYTYDVAFGDGTSNASTTASLTLGVSHTYTNYFGTAAATVTVTDALGEAATSAPLLVPVLATPLAVSQAIAAGATDVNVSWLLPASPAGGVTHYTIFSTTTASAAATMSSALFGGPAAADVTVANSTGDWLTVFVPAGATVWAEVIAWNGFGAGTLPASGTPLEARTTNLTAGPIQSTPSGGAAPFTDALSDFVLNGTNDMITQSSYASGFNGSGPTTLTPGAGGTWVNATLVLGSPGVHVVILHIADEFADFAVAITDIYVAPGGPLSISLAAPGPAGWTGWAGTALTFRATAVGGPGPFTFDWAFGDGGVGTGANVTYTYPTPGTYTLIVSVTDGTTGGVGEHSQTITVFAPPTVAIQSQPGPNGSLSWAFTALTGGGSAAPSVAWSFGDGGVGTGAHITHDYASAGTYTVNVSTTDPTGKSATASLLLTVGAGASGGTSSGTYLGLSAGTWGALTFGLVAVAVVLLLVLVVTARSRRGRGGGGLERWRASDPDRASERT